MVSCSFACFLTTLPLKAPHLTPPPDAIQAAPFASHVAERFLCEGSTHDKPWCLCKVKHRSSRLEEQLVDVAPGPLLTGLEGLNDRVVARVEMLGGVLILRTVTAADMPAFETEAQVDPPIPDSQTLLTAIGAGCHVSYVVEMATVCRQDGFLSEV
jgi:hypothetical protein